jgi:hypothetical protein
MLRIVLFFFIVGLQIEVFGQISFTGQVFILSKDFIEDKCEVSAPCDCCATDLYFLPGDKFAFVSRCLSGDVYTTGTYSVNNNKLKLNFEKKYVEEEADEQYNITGYKHSQVNMPPVEFQIVFCGQKIRLMSTKEARTQNGSRYDPSSEKSRLRKLDESMAWKQLKKNNQ